VLRAFGLTDKGRVRPINEDCFAIQEELGLCVIADGIGGHNAGEVASQLAVDAVVDVVRNAVVRSASAAGAGPSGADLWGARPWSASLSGERPDIDRWPFGYDPSISDAGNLLRTAIHVASVQVLEAAGSAHHYAGMGTTIVVARAHGGWLSVAHAGDSRLYVLARGRLRQATTDDSWLVSMLAENPDADAVALQHHPMRNALTNVVGATAHTDVHVAEQALAGGELLLLSTDGVHGVLDEKRLERMMREEDDPRTIAQSVVRAALARGSRDNCTAIVARYDDDQR
jgi:PPM family protein phosphatase